MRKNPATNAVVRAPRARARSNAALPSAVTKRINRYAHSQALHYEQALRGQVMSKLQDLADNGAGILELLAEIDQISVPDR